MSTFVFTTLTNNPDSAQYESACLGVSPSTKLTDLDIGKCVKVQASGCSYVLCATTNEIEGILVSTEAETYNSGYAFGTIQRRGRFEATVGTNQSSTLDVGELVVADTQAAINTAGGAKVITGTPSTFKWRCIRVVSGTGVAGDTVLIERV